MQAKIQKLLSEKLGPFLFNFDEKQFNMSLIKGKINLSELVIRPDKVNELLEEKNAPFMLKAGMIGKI